MQQFNSAHFRFDLRGVGSTPLSDFYKVIGYSPASQTENILPPARLVQIKGQPPAAGRAALCSSYAIEDTSEKVAVVDNVAPKCSIKRNTLPTKVIEFKVLYRQI